MFSMNDGSFISLTSKGASSNCIRRSVRRGVSTSDRIAKTGLLERRETITKLHPADVVAEPGMMRGRKSPGCIQAARRHVEEPGRVEVVVGQRRAAITAELARHLGRGLVLARCAARKAEFRLGEREPRDHR